MSAIKALKILLLSLLHIAVIMTDEPESSDSDSSEEIFRESPECAAAFVDDQGSTSQFFMPVPDYVGFANPTRDPPGPPTRFALIDYLGIADQWLMENTDPPRSFNTEVSISCSVKGEIDEQEEDDDSPDDDDTVRIRIEIQATNAMGFAYTFGGNPFDELIFGNETVNIRDNPNAAIGRLTVHFGTEFSMLSSDFRRNKFPDLVRLYINPTEDELPYEFDFEAHGTDDNNKTLDVLQLGCERTKGMSQVCDIETVDVGVL